MIIKEFRDRDRVRVITSELLPDDTVNIDIVEEYQKSSTGLNYLELCLGPNWKDYLKGNLIETIVDNGPKINADYLYRNIWMECYREIMVSYIHMLPLLKNTVDFSEADYILYMHPYARCNDLGDPVLKEIRWIAENRKPGAEIIVLGKACNVKNSLRENEISNITYYQSHFCEKLGERFDKDISEQYVVYDDASKKLSIWPVDGCKNKCRFCRRTYMDIPFESLKLEDIKKRLDWFKEKSPEKMKKVSLRAENLTQYGIDIYGNSCLEKVLSLLESYDEIEDIEIPIGLCIGEMTEPVIKAICNSKKIKGIALNLEAASDRLNKFCGKKHTMKQAREIFDRIRIANPYMYIASTIMIGIPSENIGEVETFAKYINSLGIDYLHCNMYIPNERDGFKNSEQLSDQCKYYHLKLFVKVLQKTKREEWYAFRNIHHTMGVQIRAIETYTSKKRRAKKIIEGINSFNSQHPTRFPSVANVQTDFKYYPAENPTYQAEANFLRNLLVNNGLIRATWGEIERLINKDKELIPNEDNLR